MLGNNHLHKNFAQVITIKTLFALARPSAIAEYQGEFRGLWIFSILSSCIWSPLPYETLYELYAVYLHVNGHLYPMKLYLNLPRFIFSYMVTFTLWNFIRTFRSLSSCEWSSLLFCQGDLSFVFHFFPFLCWQRR